MTITSYEAMCASGEIEAVAGSEVLDEQGNLKSVQIVSDTIRRERYGASESCPWPRGWRETKHPCDE